MSGQSFMMLRQNDQGPISATFDVTTSKGSPALLGFAGGEQAFFWAQKPVSCFPVSSQSCKYCIYASYMLFSFSKVLMFLLKNYLNRLDI